MQQGEQINTKTKDTELLGMICICSKYRTLITSSQTVSVQAQPVHYPSQPVAEFKEFERRFKFKQRFKYGWFHFKLYQMFQDLSRCLI